MRTKRIINAAVWAVIAAALCIAVAMQWSAQGAPAKSLILGTLFYTSFAALACALIDEKIRRTNK